MVDSEGGQRRAGEPARDDASPYRVPAPPKKKKRPRIRLTGRPQPAAALVVACALGLVLVLVALGAMGASTVEAPARAWMVVRGLRIAEFPLGVAGIASVVWFGSTWQLLPPERRRTLGGQPISMGLAWGLQLVPFVSALFTWFLAVQIAHAYNRALHEQRDDLRVSLTVAHLACGLPIVGVVLFMFALANASDPSFALGPPALLVSGAFVLVGEVLLLRFMFTVDRAKRRFVF